MTQTINLETDSQLFAEVTPKIIETEHKCEQFLALAEEKVINTSQANALADRFQLSRTIFIHE